MKREAAVIGAGVGGLTAANFLVRAGWEVSIFERAASLPTTGTALGMWPSAMAALDLIGVGEAVRAHGCRVTGGSILRPDGSLIARIGDRQGSVLISRPALLAGLAAALPSGAIRFGSEVNGIQSVRQFDLVVAADGLNSKIRDELFGPRYAPQFLGAVAYRGSVPGSVSTVSETWGSARLFGITPRGDGLTNWFGCVRTPRLADAGAPDPLRSLEWHFGRWHSDVVDVLARIESKSVLQHALYQTPALPTYVRGNVALIGDAVHAMAPNLGRGACESILDGAALARSLGETAGSVRDIESGLRRYDKARRRTTRRFVQASRLMGRMAMTSRWQPGRDRILSQIPG
ncbi:FAD-dependent monooxygenase [Saxibacter everestensis]|uniref:FAD-dependent monooxygenase n=1 Tax=Saxibacter everestensis TaxID=2909229 RepID=A0ABY8QYR2_9MICO|nr:FAD-dependent monooxygenase [Brevibacteriaceae bacterium ZFBP1038]